MKVIQVVPNISEESSGPSYTVPALCHSLKAAGCDVELHCISSRAHAFFDFPVFTYRKQFFPHPSLCRSPEMYTGLIRASRDADIIHTNSIWLMPNVYPAWAAKRNSCKLVAQPRGTFSAWAMKHSKWRKKLFGICCQYSALRKTDMWVATSEEEFKDIRRLGYRQPVAIIPNGVEQPVNIEGVHLSRRRMFFLSRIHPKKNIDLLLRCWAKLEERFPEWDLAIVGPDKENSYADEMKALTRTLGCRHVSFEGELRGNDKFAFMASSDCGVLPTHSENFGMVVAESLACGTPVICSHGAPWQGLVSHQCGWWVPTDCTAFVNAMADAMTLPRSVLRQMGKCGRDWMARDYSWTGIGQKTKKAYEWLRGKGDRPEWVVLD